MLKHAPWSLIAFLVVTTGSEALAQPYACGPICPKPSHWNLCNDSAPDDGSPFVADCSASYGSCTNEKLCATFEAPSSGDYPVYLTAVWVLTGPVAASAQFDLEVYLEDPGFEPEPGMRVNPLFEQTSYAITGDPQQWTRIDLTSAGTGYTINSGEFRVCLKKGFNGSHNVCMDADGQAGKNWVYGGVASDEQNPCDTIAMYLWDDGVLWPLPGDLLIRPEIHVEDDAPWQTGGACFGFLPEPDAGPTKDAGAAADGGGAIADGGATTSSDGGPTANDDAGAPGGDSGGGGGGDPEFAAPLISSITPDQGYNNVPTAVIVSGSGFVDGLTLTVGSIGATGVELSGTSTIDAIVPANIAPGVYDVVVRNPDDQVAILDDGFTVIDPSLLGLDAGDHGDEIDGDGDGDDVTTADACACSSTRPGRAASWPGALALLLALAALGRSRPRGGR